MMKQPAPNTPPRYAWPKYVLASVVLFFVLAVLWMSFEVARVKRLKIEKATYQDQFLQPQTSPPGSTPNLSATNVGK